MPHIHELYDFTVSAYILHPTEQKICLHFHKKLKSWMQVGGHIELDEDPEQALYKEIFEEAGIAKDDIEIIQLADRPTVSTSKSLPIPFQFEVHAYENGHGHIDLQYLVRSKTTLLKPQENESAQIGWFNKNDIEQLYKEKLIFKDNYEKCFWIFANYHKL